MIRLNKIEGPDADIEDNLEEKGEEDDEVDEVVREVDQTDSPGLNAGFKIDRLGANDEKARSFKMMRKNNYASRKRIRVKNVFHFMGFN